MSETMPTVSKLTGNDRRLYESVGVMTGSKAESAHRDWHGSKSFTADRVSNSGGTATVEGARTALPDGTFKRWRGCFDRLNRIRQPNGVGGASDVQRDDTKSAMLIIVRTLLGRLTRGLTRVRRGCLSMGVMRTASRMAACAEPCLRRSQMRMMQETMRGRIDSPDTQLSQGHENHTNSHQSRKHRICHNCQVYRSGKHFIVKTMLNHNGCFCNSMSITMGTLADPA